MGRSPQFRKCRLGVASHAAHPAAKPNRCQLRPWSKPIAVIDYSEKENKLTFTVRVVPRASRSEIVGEHAGALRVRLAAPPVEGAANEELIRILARALKVPRTSIAIIGGSASKLKRVAVNGIPPDALLKLPGIESK